MKRYISLLLVFAVAMLFFVQSNGFAKTAKQANEELSKVYDGVTYHKLNSPKNYRSDSQGSDDVVKRSRFSKWFVVEIDSLGKRVVRFWHQVLPIIYKNYKFKEVVD